MLINSLEFIQKRYRWNVLIFAVFRIYVTSPNLEKKKKRFSRVLSVVGGLPKS